MIGPCRFVPLIGSEGFPSSDRPVWRRSTVRLATPPMTGGLFALNFFSPAFVDQLKRGRKTATIRLGDKSRKYQRGQIVWITVGYQHSPREKIFAAVIDDVEVKRVRDLSPRDIEHDNPEFRRLEETVSFLRQIYGRDIEPRGHRDGDPLLADRRVASAPQFGNGETPSPN